MTGADRFTVDDVASFPEEERFEPRWRRLTSRGRSRSIYRR
jgi:hypothetical protein